MSSSSFPILFVRALRLLGRFALVFAACAALYFVHWVADTFGDITLGQVLFHWHHLGGSSSIAKITSADFLVQCGLWPALTALLILWLERRLVLPLLQRANAAQRTRWFTRGLAWLPCLVIAGGLATLAWRTSALQYLGPPDPNDYFARHYVRPAGVKLAPESPKNLVLIYVESLETSYTDSAVFGKDLLANLSALHPVSFPVYEQLPGTGYTIAAMVSTMCAAPLQMVGFLDWRSQGEHAQRFLPGAVCLGDLLATQGYRNVFMGGAALEFSGKDKLLKEHHYQEAYGRVEWNQLGIPKSRMSGWGLHDDDLFAQAKTKLRELHDAKQPFNLTLLTVDSHWPSGFVSEACQQRGAQGLDDVMACTAWMVADLVKFVRTSGYDADTNIVVIGDHLSPPNTLADKLAQVPRRTIYNAFFARTPPQPNRDTIVHFDLLPTILDFIGLHVDGGREGLGYSAFGPASVPLPNAETRAELGAHVLTPSRTYFQLWEAPQVSAVAGP